MSLRSFTQMIANQLFTDVVGNHSLGITAVGSQTRWSSRADLIHLVLLWAHHDTCP